MQCLDDSISEVQASFYLAELNKLSLALEVIEENHEMGRYSRRDDWICAVVAEAYRISDFTIIFRLKNNYD